MRALPLPDAPTPIDLSPLFLLYGGPGGAGGGAGGASGPGDETLVIPPILSCGSASSAGSDKDRRKESPGGGVHRPPSPTHPVGATGYKSAGGMTGLAGQSALAKSSVKGTAASAKELPVWLVGMYLLLHCEQQAYLRNVSGEDERRFSKGSSADSPRSGGAGGVVDHLGGRGGVDFSALLQHTSLSPR